MIPSRLLLCRRHWEVVPARLQRSVLTAWDALKNHATLETLRAHQAAKKAAIEYVNGWLDRYRPTPTPSRTLTDDGR